MTRLLALMTVFLAPLALAEAWNQNNHPNHFLKILDTSVTTHFDHLPLMGRLDDQRLGWSETYWPSNKGGIAYRWYHPRPNPFRNAFLTKEELQKMSLKELEKLSPAELYDISQGDYKYSLTRKTLELNKENALWWEGICHGWSQAASNYPEPAEVLVKNPDGISVPFGSSDVKGLLSMHGAYNSKGFYTHIGGRCTAPGKVPGEASSRDGYAPMPVPEIAETEDCKDVNAGAFHLIISNMIGLHSLSFVADVDRFNDVWNQPVVGYDSAILEELPVETEQVLAGITRRLKVQLEMTYGEELQFDSSEARARGEINIVSKKPVTRTPHQAFRSKLYEYILELDLDGNITGGEWISLTRPDFIWIKKRDSTFLNSPLPLGGLSQIYLPVKW